jgi:hypothetical protein
MAASAVTLYAWALPAFFSGAPIDHTWVTTYDNRTKKYKDNAKVIDAGEDYWWCWGSFHREGGTPINPDGFLGSTAADLALARCLVESNADSRHVVPARGTIMFYGIDGACHQCANQVLFASTGALLLVSLARGYYLSSGLYGDYGVNTAAWYAKIASCTGTTASAQALPTMDTFEQRARTVLSGPDDLPVLEELLRLREEARRNLEAMRARAAAGNAPPAEEINAVNQRYFDKAAALLGAHRYERIFGAPPGQVTLVDPTIRDERGRPVSR